MAKLTYGTTISAIYDPQVGAPLDSRMAVAKFSDLIDITTWKTDGGTSAEAYSYYGMLVYVGQDGDKNGLYTLQPSGIAGKTVKDDTQTASCWVRISQTDAKIQAIIDRVYAGEIDISELNSAIETKLAKDFGSYSAASALTSETKVPAQIGNENVYITGEQIKTFAASAVSDKGTFETEEALNAAFANPEDGWTATVLSTGTTWIANGGVWTDSGKASGVTSINGKTGIVTLVANDVGAYTKAEVFTYIGEAKSTLESQITTVDTRLTTYVGEISTKISDNATAISNLGSELDLFKSNHTSFEGRITALEYAGEDLEDRVDVYAGEFNTLKSDWEAHKSQYTELSTRIDNVDGRLTTYIGEIKSFATSEAESKSSSALTTAKTYAGEIDSRLSGQISGHATRITDLETKSNSLQASITENTNKLGTVESTANEAKAKAESNASSIASQGSDIAALKVAVKTYAGEAEAAAKTYADGIDTKLSKRIDDLAAIDQFTVEVVSATSEGKPNVVEPSKDTIYLVPIAGRESAYAEYLYITTDGESKWEMIGTTDVDLSNYFTKDDTTSLVHTYAGEAEAKAKAYAGEIDAKLSGQISTVDTRLTTYVGEIDTRLNKIETTDWKSKLNYFSQSDGEALEARVYAGEIAIATIKSKTDNIVIATVSEQTGTVAIPANAINFKVIFDFEAENKPNRIISEVYGRNEEAVVLSEVVVGSNSAVITSVSETTVSFDLGVVPTKAVITVTTL
jgi:peptidoglycan hydrolase CwlO-like protein